MIYRKANGDLIIINKLKFTNDKLFYSKMMELAKEYKEIGNNIYTNIPKITEKNSNNFVPLDLH